MLIALKAPRSSQPSHSSCCGGGGGGCCLNTCRIFKSRNRSHTLLLPHSARNQLSPSLFALAIRQQWSTFLAAGGGVLGLAVFCTLLLCLRARRKRQAQSRLGGLSARATFGEHQLSERVYAQMMEGGEMTSHADSTHTVWSGKKKLVFVGLLFFWGGGRWKP